MKTNDSFLAHMAGWAFQISWSNVVCLSVCPGVGRTYIQKVRRIFFLFCTKQISGQIGQLLRLCKCKKTFTGPALLCPWTLLGLSTQTPVISSHTLHSLNSDPGSASEQDGTIHNRCTQRLVSLHTQNYYGIKKCQPVWPTLRSKIIAKKWEWIGILKRA